MRAKNWTYDETLLAFDLYCKTPFGKIHYRNPDIIKLSSLLRRSPSSVAMKMVNFASLDPELQKRNIKGLSNSSKMDRLVWRDFFENGNELIVRAYNIVKELERQAFSEIPKEEAYASNEELFPPGANKKSISSQRIGQDFFRKTVLASYNLRCCITGISVKSLLIASHIKPWAKSDDILEKTNPRNGLCLNALHDRAFDNGLISIDEDYRILVSKELKRSEFSPQSIDFFLRFERKKIELPSKFMLD